MNYRQRCGVGLICLSCVLWGLILLLPWSGLSTSWQVFNGVGLYILNYACFFAGVWLLGKKMWGRFKVRVAEFFRKTPTDNEH